jgi:signal transduction histidine kinase
MSGVRSLLRLDPDGVLIAAEGPLGMLNTAAGGGVGVPLALPAVAALVRLARRLEIAIARAATVADGDRKLELWLRVRPLPGETRVESDNHPEDDDSHEPFTVAEADFDWQCDSTMTVTVLAPIDAADAAIGAPLTRAFDLSDDDGMVHLLTAAANRTSFSDRPARLVSTGQTVLLSGRSVLSPSGAFAGFVGTGRFEPSPSDAATADAEPPGLADAFADRLDRALRTPLQRIVAHADSIGAQSDGPLRTEYVEYAHDIASAARHLMGLVDDLVDLSAIERPDFAVAVEPIDLADVARRAAGLLAVRAAAAAIEIHRPEPDSALPARGEYRRTLQILVNLVGNAVRYSPHGSQVWLTLARSDDRVSVTVADEGRGIAERDQARIFDKFGRVDPNEPGGNGLGLYIARRLARAMGGDIAVDSQPGQGARFTLTLPAA